MGPVESSLVDRYAAVRRRVAYPQKPRIAVVERGEGLKSPIVAAHTYDKPAAPHRFNRKRLFELFIAGISYAAIGRELNAPDTSVRRYCRRQGWKR